MAKKALRVLQVTTDSESMREVDDNARRLGILAAALKVAKKQRSSVVQFPAGFLSVKRDAIPEKAVKTLLKERVVPLARSTGIAIVGGVDVTHEGTKSAALPYYGYIIDNSGQLHGPWKQQSSTSGQSDKGTPATNDNKVEVDERLARVGDREGTLFVCGEMHNSWNRNALAEHSPGIVFVSGHAGYTRVTRSVRSVATHGGAPVLHVQHLSSPTSGLFHAIDAEGEHVSDVGTVVRGAGGRWWRWTLRVLPEKRHDRGEYPNARPTA